MYLSTLESRDCLTIVRSLEGGRRETKACYCARYSVWELHFRCQQCIGLCCCDFSGWL